MSAATIKACPPHGCAGQCFLHPGQREIPVFHAKAVQAEPDQLAKLLARSQAGDPSANEELLALLYEDLRRLAHWHMARERGGGAGYTLQATALVHEAYLRLVAGRPMAVNDRRHFFAAAGLAMRRILVERARRVSGPQAGGGLCRVELDAEISTAGTGDEPDWEALDRAVTALAAEDPELAEIVHLRYYAGLGLNEVAAAIGTSARTTSRRWQVARAWILDFLVREGGGPRS